MHDVAVKVRAKTLRYSGASIYEISSRLSVPKSTISLWCRDITLSPSQVRALDKKQRERSLYGSLRAAEKKRALRLRDTKLQRALGANDIKNITKRDLLLLGMGLYWGEGYKYGNNELGFTNSDPQMVRMFLRWIKDIYEIRKKDLILRVSINALYKTKIRDSVEYWAKLTGTNSDQFTKTSLIKTSLRKFNDSNEKPYFGTLRIKVRKATKLHRRILGSLEHLAKLT